MELMVINIIDSTMLGEQSKPHKHQHVAIILLSSIIIAVIIFIIVYALGKNMASPPQSERLPSAPVAKLTTARSLFIDKLEKMPLASQSEVNSVIDKLLNSKAKATKAQKAAVIKLLNAKN